MKYPYSAESLDAKAIEAKARELLDREYGKDHPAARHSFTLTFTTTTYEHRVQELAKSFAEVMRETLDAADRALRAAETPELPEGQAIGLSLAREVLANLAYRLASPEAIRTAEREGA